MRINFDFIDLEVFLTVLETGSFHVASEKLGLSQSSVSRRVQKLESSLDSRLFHRTTRDVKPTLAAKRLKARAEVILDETKEAARAMRDESAVFSHQLAQSLTVAIVPTVISGVLIPALDHLNARLPNTRIRVLDLAANEVSEAVAQGEADIGICSVPTLEPSTAFEFLFDDPIVIALRADNRLAEKDQLTWSDLSDEDLILPSRGTGNRMLIDDAMARAGLPLTWKIEVGRTSTALECVSAGLGIAPLPKSVFASGHQIGILAKSVGSPSIARPIGILTRIGDARSGLSRHISDIIRASI